MPEAPVDFAAALERERKLNATLNERIKEAVRMEKKSAERAAAAEADAARSKEVLINAQHALKRLIADATKLAADASAVTGVTS